MAPPDRLLSAVVALAIGALLPAQRDYLTEQIVHALDAARPALLQHLQQATAQRVRAGELALLCLAALHDGVATDDKVLQPALARLAKSKPDGTYDLALRLMVLEADSGFPDRDRLARADAKELLAHAHAGGFHYQRSSSWDLSNTQYGALGLRSALALGLKVPKTVWMRLADAVHDAQCGDGSFAYTPRSGGGTASMTAAGIAVLQVCAQNVDDNGRTRTAIDAAVAKAWQWFDANKDCVGDPAQAWSYYFHYGLERAGILSDVTTVGGDDWYRKGARMLLDAQGGGGGWVSAPDFGGSLPAADAKIGQPVPTAFAILFLRRKFQKVAGPLTGPATVSLGMLTEQSGNDDVKACAEQLVRRGKAALPEVLKALRDDLRPRRRAAAQALRGLAGQDFGYDPDAGAEASAAALRAAELWYLKQR